MNNPTLEEIQKVVAILDKRNIQVTYCDLPFSGCVTLGTDDVIQLANTPDEDWKDEFASRMLGIDKGLIKEWYENLDMNDIVYIRCSGITTKGKSCKMGVKTCQGIYEWIKHKDDVLYCEHHAYQGKYE